MTLENLIPYKKGMKLPKFKIPIMVGSYEVKKVTKVGFLVGCKRVSWKTYDAIGKLRPKK
jgi:hypothetical protein